MYQDLGLTVDGTEESLRKDLVSTSMTIGLENQALESVMGAFVYPRLADWSSFMVIL